MRKITIALAVALTTIAVLPAAPAQADDFGGSCSVWYSGTDARRSCSYTSLPWPFSRIVMEVDGYAWAQVFCDGLMVFNSGVRETGAYEDSFLNPGGTCTLTTAVSGWLYARAN